MSDFSTSADPNSIQPISDDYSTDGFFEEYARIDHQHPLSTTLRNKIFHKSNIVEAVTDTAGVSRGSFYGISFHSDVVTAAFTIPGVGPFNVLNVNLPLAPIGGFITADFSAYFTQLLGGNVATAQLALDGTPLGPRAIFGVAGQVQISNGITGVAVSAATHIVSLFVSELGTPNSSRIQNGDSIVRVTYYR